MLLGADRANLGIKSLGHTVKHRPRQLIPGFVQSEQLTPYRFNGDN